MAKARKENDPTECFGRFSGERFFSERWNSRASLPPHSWEKVEMIQPGHVVLHRDDAGDFVFYGQLERQVGRSTGSKLRKQQCSDWFEKPCDFNRKNIFPLSTGKGLMGERSYELLWKSESLLTACFRAEGQEKREASSPFCYFRWSDVIRGDIFILCVSLPSPLFN